MLLLRCALLGGVKGSLTVSSFRSVLIRSGDKWLLLLGKLDSCEGDVILGNLSESYSFSFGRCSKASQGAKLKLCSDLKMNHFQFFQREDEPTCTCINYYLHHIRVFQF
jgi:hypothetical protein